MIHRLQRTQRLPVGLSEAWDFFSNPKNLNLITPPDLGFRITSDTPPKIYQGAVIRYKVTPLLQIPVTWVTEIAQVSEPHFFADNQLVGPYRLWHHEHHFHEKDGGVEVEDIVHYALPFGLIGAFVDKLLVRKRLKEIFDYREETLLSRFGTL